MKFATSPVSPCAVCSYPSRGFGWFDVTRGTRRPSVRFCSEKCQIWYTLQAKGSYKVVDITEQETVAFADALQREAEVMGRIGWATTLADLTLEQIQEIIMVAVRGYQDSMRQSTKISDDEVPF